MHSALTPNQSERIAGCKTDRRSFLMRGKWRQIIHVNESLMRGRLWRRRRRDQLALLFVKKNVVFFSKKRGEKC